MDARALRGEFKEQIVLGLKDTAVAKYLLFAPKSISKATTHSLRKTIHLIAFNRLADIKPAIISVKAALEEMLVDQASEKKIIAYTECMNKLTSTFDQDDFYSSSEDKILDKLLGAIDEVLKSRSLKITGDKAELLNELKVWIEGLYLHISIQRTRITWQACVSDANKQHNVEYPIKEKKRKEVSKGVSDTLKAISKMETEQSQPIILSIIKEIERASVGNASILDFCQLGFNKIWETVELDYEGDMAKLNYLTKNKDTILPELQSLLERASIANSGSEMIGSLVQELSLYLQGLYYYFYEKSNAWSAPAKNLMVSKATSTIIPNMLTIAEYYYRYAMAIEQAMQAALQQKSPISLVNAGKMDADKEPTIEELASSLFEYEAMDENGQIHGLKFSLETVGIPAKLCRKVDSVIIASAKDVLRRYIDEIEGRSSAGSWFYQSAKSLVSQNHLSQARSALDLLTSLKDVKAQLIAIVSSPVKHTILK